MPQLLRAFPENSEPMDNRTPGRKTSTAPHTAATLTRRYSSSSCSTNKKKLMRHGHHTLLNNLHVRHASLASRCGYLCQQPTTTTAEREMACGAAFICPALEQAPPALSAINQKNCTLAYTPVSDYTEKVNRVICIDCFIAHRIWRSNIASFTEQERRIVSSTGAADTKAMLRVNVLGLCSPNCTPVPLGLRPHHRIHQPTHETPRGAFQYISTNSLLL